MKTKITLHFFAKNPKTIGKRLLPILQDHNSKIKECAHRTQDRYRNSLNHTIEFLEWKYNISDIKISKMYYSFITVYEFYIRCVRNRSSNTQHYAKVLNKEVINNMKILKDKYNLIKLKK